MIQLDVKLEQVSSNLQSAVELTFVVCIPFTTMKSLKRRSSTLIDIFWQHILI